MSVNIKMKVSPKFYWEHLDGGVDRKIDVFEDRINGWFFDWINLLNKQEHGGIAVLSLAFWYFESIMIYMKGEDSKNKSTDFFNEGVKDVFPDLKRWDDAQIQKFLELFHKHGRCGFYHWGMSRKSIVLLDNPFAIQYLQDQDAIIIDRYKFIDCIQAHFKKYIQKLRNGELTDKFEKAWNIHNS